MTEEKKEGRRVQISREEQLEILLERYQNLVFSICYRLTDDYFAAEDLAQETFLSVYEKYSSFDGKNEKAWICKIATNKGLDYLKAAGRRNVPVEDSYFAWQETKESSPEEKTLEDAVRAELYESCRKLKSPYDEVALDYYYYELDVGEIAQKRNKNPKTIQTQIYRARGMLRKKYQEKGEAE